MPTVTRVKTGGYQGRRGSSDTNTLSILQFQEAQSREARAGWPIRSARTLAPRSPAGAGPAIVTIHGWPICKLPKPRGCAVKVQQFAPPDPVWDEYELDDRNPNRLRLPPPAHRLADDEVQPFLRPARQVKDREARTRALMFEPAMRPRVVNPTMADALRRAGLVCP